MRVKSLSEAFRGMAGVSLREPEAEVFSASLVTGAVTPKRGVFYVLPDTDSLEETFPEFAESREASLRKNDRRARRDRR